MKIFKKQKAAPGLKVRAFDKILKHGINTGVIDQVLDKNTCKVTFINKNTNFMANVYIKKSYLRTVKLFRKIY